MLPLDKLLGLAVWPSLYESLSPFYPDFSPTILEKNPVRFEKNPVIFPSGFFARARRAALESSNFIHLMN
jgi:hypothetical protein